MVCPFVWSLWSLFSSIIIYRECRQNMHNTDLKAHLEGFYLFARHELLTG
ncbi:hypothetical protein KP509_04G018400 [Ceratopteris richardii]|uniref:Uncharacterized protein n=1 Tax=Ceratopteris richardii TaxID=49495 RepID=A0A8T2UX88_CERRI|nr:hypothetical protein KP509_04G018400 [Ceratopteris richardii]